MEPEILLLNPRRRKRRRKHARKSSRRVHRARRRGGYRVRRRRLRNPRAFGKSLSVRGITGSVAPAAVGALGALALDIGMAYAPLPDALKSGWGKTLAQLGGALLLGFIAAKVPFVGKRNAQIGTLGALTIVAYNAIRPLAAQTLGDKVKGLSGLADFADGSFGAYMNPAALLQTGRTSPIARMGAYMQPQLSGGYSGDMF